MKGKAMKIAANFKGSRQEPGLQINFSITRATPLLTRLGFWAALTLSTMNILYMLMVLVSLATDTSNLQLLSALPVLVALPAFMALLVTLHYYAPEEKKPLTQLALLNGVAYVVLAGFTYFVQVTVIRQNLLKVQYQNYVMFDLQNQDSIAAVTDMAGYFFLGLALLCLVPLFAKSADRLERWIGRLVLVAGGAGLVAASSFIADWQTIRYLALVLLCPLLLFSAILLVFFFRQGE
jgi:hypothetical protein